MKIEITTELQEIASDIEELLASGKNKFCKALDLNHLLGQFYAYAQVLRLLDEYDDFCAELDVYDSITSAAVAFCENVYEKFIGE